MTIERLRTVAQLDEVSSEWNRLSRAVPFRSWDWLDAWWRYYGQSGPWQSPRELCVLTVHAGAELVGLAPWYLSQSIHSGRLLQFLGTGEVFSDYLSVLAADGHESTVAVALADWLADHGDEWDALEMSGVDAEDPTVTLLLAELEERDIAVRHQTDFHCWRIALPEGWPGLLATLSKSHRKQVRRLERRYFDTGRVTTHRAENLMDLEVGYQTLLHLHRRRWSQRGRAGSFSSERFIGFHRCAAERLMASGKLRLEWLELDDRPLAAEYQLLGRDVIYAYQSGIDPERLDDEPGRLATIQTLHRSIDEGYRAYDLLRGDEAYKAHWRAVPRRTLRLRAVPPRAMARLRGGIWSAEQQVKAWVKGGLKVAGIWMA